MSKEICVNYDATDVTCESCILNKVQTHNSCYKAARKENKTIMQNTVINTDQVNHPSHYQQEDRLECIEEMRLMFGDEQVKQWCRMTAYKYYYRAGNKVGESAVKDRAKAMFYLNYIKKVEKGEI